MMIVRKGWTLTMWKIDTGKKDKGILYLLELELEDKKLVKIGVTSRPMRDRLAELCIAMWNVYRYVPRIYVKKYTLVEGYISKEKELHKYFKNRKYKCEHNFCGSCEVFDAPMEEVVEIYNKINGIGNKE